MSTFKWTDREVRAALGLEGGSDDVRYPKISTDTRSIGAGDLFVALRGDRFDAHEFLAGAAEAGAAGAVVSRIPPDAPRLRYYEVADTLRALGALAAYRRHRLTARVVGVAGSNGKTTTKELIRAALADSFRSHATEGNLNNQIGVPQTLLATPDDAEAVVVEMGTNVPGEIEILAKIVRPDAGVITSIGEEHLEGLGSIDGVLEEELELLTGLQDGGLLIVADEPRELHERARAALGAGAVRIAGFSEDADLRPDGGYEAIEVLPDGTTRWSWEGHQVHLPLPGRFNVRNALIALGLATEWGVSPEAAARGISSVSMPKLRGQWVKIGDLRVLADCYNSNPPSARAAVELLSEIPAGGRKIAVLGTMREMGGAAEQVHREVAERVVSTVGDGVDVIVATGDFVQAFEPYHDSLGDHLVSDVDPIAAYHELAPRLRGDETLLLKASRGEALERWIDLLTQKFTPSP